MKRRAVVALLLLFAAWPLAHAVLTTQYGVDPWKLFGFSMYAVPGPMRTVRVFELQRGAAPRGLDYRRYEEPVQRAVDHFRERRRALGELHPMSALAEAMLDLHPTWEGVGVAVISLELDPETARLASSQVEEAFWRSGESSVPVQAEPSPR